MDYEDENEKMRHAELLCAMDVVARHINDEDIGDIWLVDGVPDGGDFHIFNDNTEERRKYYGDLVDCMDECDFEYTVKLFAKLVKRLASKRSLLKVELSNGQNIMAEWGLNMRVYEAYIDDPKDNCGSCFRKFYGYDLRQVKKLCRLIAGKGGAFSIHLGNALTGKCVYQYF